MNPNDKQGKEPSATPLDPAHVLWQKRVLDMVSIGGIWGGKDFPVLVKKVSENEVEIIMAPDDLVRRHIEAAGYKVIADGTIKAKPEGDRK